MVLNLKEKLIRLLTGKKELEELGNPVIEIRVKRFEAENLPVEIARFVAIQYSTGTNLEYVGNKNTFRRDVNIKKNEVQESLIYKLNINNLSREEKIKVVEKKIKEQEKLIASFKDGYAVKKFKCKYTDDEKETAKLNHKELPEFENKKVKVNIIDEENKLKHYKVLLDDVKYNGDGSYVEMVNGLRVMHLKYEDGLYYPFKWIKGSANIYADNGTKQKHFKSSDVLIKEEHADALAGTGSVQWLRIVQIASIILLIANIGFMYYTYQVNADFGTTMVKETSKIVTNVATEIAKDICHTNNQTIIDKVINQTLVQNITTNI